MGNIQSSDAEYVSKIRKEQEDCSRIRDGLSRNKLENTVVSVAQFASRDFSNAQNQNNGGNSTAPQTPSDSPATGQAGAKTEPKDDEPLSPVSDSPPSPKYVEEKVEIWSGL